MATSNKKSGMNGAAQGAFGGSEDRAADGWGSEAYLADQSRRVRELIPIICEERQKEELRRERYGWLGEGPYTSNHPAYRPWCNMIRRALAGEDPKKLAARDPDCWNGILGEWMNFQNFAAWWDAQYEFRNCPQHIKLQLDKDLFCVWSRLYGPDTCALLPASINKLLSYYDPNKGIKQHTRTGKWFLTSRKYGRLVACNEFDTMDDAYFARADVIRCEVISIATPLRDMFSDRVWEQLVSGYWIKLREYMQPSVQAVAEVMRKAEEDIAARSH